MKRDEEDEEVWVRNDTNYSQDTDSDELLGVRKSNDECMSGITDGVQRKIIVDEILYAEGFYKKDGT